MFWCCNELILSDGEIIDIIIVTPLCNCKSFVDLSFVICIPLQIARNFSIWQGRLQIEYIRTVYSLFIIDIGWILCKLINLMYIYTCGYPIYKYISFKKIINVHLIHFVPNKLSDNPMCSTNPSPSMIAPVIFKV